MSGSAGAPSAAMIGGMVLLGPTTSTVRPRWRSRIRAATAAAWLATVPPVGMVSGTSPRRAVSGAAVSPVRRLWVTTTPATPASASAAASAWARARPTGLSSGSSSVSLAFSACRTSMTIVVGSARAPCPPAVAGAQAAPDDAPAQTISQPKYRNRRTPPRPFRVAAARRAAGPAARRSARR